MDPGGDQVSEPAKSQPSGPVQPNTSDPPFSSTSQPQTWIYEGMDPELLPRKRGRPKKGSEKSQTSTHNLQFMMDQLKSFKKARTQFDIAEPSSKQYSQSVTLSGGSQARLPLRASDLGPPEMAGASLQQAELLQPLPPHQLHDQADIVPMQKTPQRLVGQQQQALPQLQQQLYEQEKPMPLGPMEQPPKPKYAASSSYNINASPRVSSSQLLAHVGVLVQKDYGSTCRDAEELTLWQTIKCILRIHQPGLDFREIIGRALEIMVNRLTSKNPPPETRADIDAISNLATTLLQEAGPPPRQSLSNQPSYPSQVPQRQSLGTLPPQNPPSHGPGVKHSSIHVSPGSHAGSAGLQQHLMDASLPNIQHIMDRQQGYITLQGQDPAMLPPQQQQLAGIGLGGHGLGSQQPMHMHLESGHVQGHPQYEMYGARADLMRRKSRPGRHMEDEDESTQ